jgi:hypothetical protein
VPQPRETSRSLGVLAAVAVHVAAAVVVIQRLGETMPTRAITPSADAYVSTAHATENYGRAEWLRLDSTPQIMSYLRFHARPRPGRRRPPMDRRGVEE